MELDILIPEFGFKVEAVITPIHKVLLLTITMIIRHPEADFSWGLHSRVNNNYYHEDAINTIVSAYDPFSVGSCEVYLAVDNEPESPSDPDRMILSYDDYGTNCHGYALGLGSFYSSEKSGASNERPPGFTLMYECTNSPRYVGCPVFTHEGANQYNADVAIQGTYVIFGPPPYNTINWGHSLIKGKPYGIPSGFDWTNEGGNNNIVFITVNDFTNSEFIAYYKWEGKCAYFDENNNMIHQPCSTNLKSRNNNGAITLKESIEMGLTCLDLDSINQQDRNNIRNLVCPDEQNFYYEFENKLKSYLSNENFNTSFEVSAEYVNLYEYGIKNSNVAVLCILDNYRPNNNHKLTNLIKDLIPEQFTILLREVLEERKNNLFSDSGCYLAPNEHTQTVRALRKYVSTILATKECIKRDAISSNLSDLLIIPNPVENNATITFLSDSNQNDYKLKISNTNGVVVHSQILSEQPKNVILDIDFSDLTTGLYFIEILNETDCLKGQLIKK